VRLQYFAMLREATGKEEEEWLRPAATLDELIRDLVARYGVDFGRWVYADGKLSELAIILVNGRDVRHLSRGETRLGPGDSVVIFPPVAGG
jgi:molybdopterin synthase sulfur carrier subunit